MSNLTPFRIEFTPTFNEAIDALIEDGIPRNSFILINGEPGTGKSAVMWEFIYRRLKSGEPIILLLFENSPISVIQRFLGMGWNVLPYIGKGLFKIIDCFSFRMLDRDNPMKMIVINELVLAKISEEITIPPNPRDFQSILLTIKSIVQKMDKFIIGDENTKLLGGILAIDSLTELLTVHKQESVLEFIKTVRARLCKERFMQVIAINNVGIFDSFTALISYFMDFIFDFRFEPEAMKRGVLLKQFRIRKSSGTASKNIWLFFEIQKELGLTVPESILNKIEDAYSSFFNSNKKNQKNDKEAKNEQSNS
ncbi:MAG: RAD55 family ATPase [Candidatus Helarchaeota archaeon]